MAFDERVVNGMRVLSAIVDCGSFNGAGEMLDMSQSGVSRSVARLEARLGIRLFDRTTRSVALTDEGRRFYEQILPLLAGLEEAGEFSEFFYVSRNGTVWYEAGEAMAHFGTKAEGHPLPIPEPAQAWTIAAALAISQRRA